MSEYEYIHPTSGGPNLTICAFDKAEARVWVSSNRQPGGIGSYIPAADAPAVALELLKAAGMEAVILPMGAAPEVEDLGDGDLRCGMTDVTSTTSARWARARAAELAAIAAHRESAATREAAEKAEAEAAMKKLQERRGAALAALLPEAAAANNLPEPHELSTLCDRALDFILELQDKLASRD